jgi:hypothetical protein
LSPVQTFRDWGVISSPPMEYDTLFKWCNVEKLRAKVKR